MALHKAEHGEDIDKMSDHDKLLILIISDISTSVSACVNEMCDDLYDQKILNQHELATVISRVLLQTATDFIERAIELEPERDMELTEEILFAFNDLRPDVQAIVFEEDGIHVFDNKVRDENEDEEDDEYEQ
jgi:Na+-translocating ferredoxin:NAD+ oxidoreductase RnfG subunit